MFTVAEAKESLTKRRPAHTLWNNHEFQQWKKGIDLEMAALKDAGIVITSKPNAAQEQVLQMLSMDAPKTQEEQLRVYLACKAVVSFWTRKLALLERESERFRETEKALNER